MTAGTTAKTAFQAERFRKLIAAVEAVPDERFEMRVWVERRPCGTVGCAFGHYALAHAPDLMDYNVGGYAVVVPGVGQDPFPFIGGHFGISGDEAEYLFDCAAYEDDRDSRADVLDRLREFLASKE